MSEIIQAWSKINHANDQKLWKRREMPSVRGGSRWLFQLCDANKCRTKKRRTTKQKKIARRLRNRTQLYIPIGPKQPLIIKYANEPANSIYGSFFETTTRNITWEGPKRTSEKICDQNLSQFAQTTTARTTWNTNNICSITDLWYNKNKEALHAAEKNSPRLHKIVKHVTPKKVKYYLPNVFSKPFNKFFQSLSSLRNSSDKR